MTDLTSIAGSFLLTAISFLAAMSVVIVIHELGHYLAARSCGVRSDKFSLGFGPSLFSRTDRRGTTWSLSAIPLGGYVRFPADGEAAGKPLNESSVLVRMFIILAGPFSNFLLSAIVFAMVALNNGAPSPEMRIGVVHPTPPGWENGLLSGDRIMAINGDPVTSWDDLFEKAQDIQADPFPVWTVTREGEEIDVTAPHPHATRVTTVAPGMPAAEAGIIPGEFLTGVGGVPVRSVQESRDALASAGEKAVPATVWSAEKGERLVTLTPVVRAMRTEDGLTDSAVIGIGSGFGAIEPEIAPLSITEAAASGVRMMTSVITGSMEGLAGIIFGSIGTCNLGGALTIAENSAYAASAGGLTFLLWIATLSAAIGFFNLLPIPGLDGGHVAMFSYESLFRKPPSARIVSNLAFVGTSIILGFMIMGITSDLVC